MQLSGLPITIPESHQAWSDDDYAGRVVVYLARSAGLELGLGEPGGAAGAGDPEGQVQGALVDAVALCLEWAARRGWEYADVFKLGAHWPDRGLLFAVLRSTEAVASAHWALEHRNPAVGRERLAFAIGHILDYAQQRGWPIAELLIPALARKDRA